MVVVSLAQHAGKMFKDVFYIIIFFGRFVFIY